MQIGHSARVIAWSYDKKESESTPKLFPTLLLLSNMEIGRLWQTRGEKFIL
jgi:hypothetical protein